MTLRLRFTLCTLAGFVALGACGDDSPSTSGTNGSSGSSTSAASTSAAASSSGAASSGGGTVAGTSIGTSVGDTTAGGSAGTSTGADSSGGSSGGSSGDSGSSSGDANESSGSSSGDASDSGPMCTPEGESCAGVGPAACCPGLNCCSGVPVPPGAEFCGSVCPISDYRRKREFAAIDVDDVLDKVAALPITTWSYRHEDSSIRHIGPMAQDFMASFEVGATDTSIFVVDADGVSLAAIQALNKRLVAAEAENTELRTTIETLEQRLTALEAR